MFPFSLVFCSLTRCGFIHIHTYIYIHIYVYIYINIWYILNICVCVIYIHTHIHISFFRFTGIPESGNRGLSTRKSPALSLHLLHILCYFFQNSYWMYVRPSFSILHVPKHFLPMFHPCTCVSFWATSSNLPPDSRNYLTTCTYHPVKSSPWRFYVIPFQSWQVLGIY